ncbi:MAG TPA: cupin domain-containing protein [Aromatoleum sp.]|uniref:cupin domain-containing protein n=1 Tax=Aromatoleum sp. TaxID=2307007 RepID=UPI002B4667A9|nr:cupin domain-containing protein [Aromatoleum sp.]HJV24728.1 cupin domain-containing protein [Aromatoleum sp.]
MTATTESAFGRVVHAADSYVSKQGSTYAPGISAETVGSKVVFLGIVTLPPEGRTRAHVHAFHESAFYLMSGEEVELCTGSRLEHREIARPGDYLFIPANVPHVAVNRGKTPAVFVGVRNEPTAQESVVMMPELDELVP